MRRYLLVACLAVSVLSGCTQQQTTAPAAPETTPVVAGEIGSRLPDFVVKDLDGHEISSNNLRSDVVLIDFWATWCKPCEKEMPGYQRLVDRYGPRGFRVIGLTLDTLNNSKKPRAFAAKIGVRYPLAIATDDLKARFGGIKALPTAMIYDRQGLLRAKIVGFEREEVIESAVKPLL